MHIDNICFSVRLKGILKGLLNMESSDDFTYCLKNIIDRNDFSSNLKNDPDWDKFIISDIN